MDAEWLKTQFGLHPDKTKAGLAKVLGLEPPAVSKIIAGKRQIKAHEYMGMRKFFNLPTDGQKSLEKQGSYVLEPLNNNFSDQDDKTDQDSWVMPAHLFAQRTKATPDKIKIFGVQGDAMAPDFMQGEQVLVDLSDQKPTPAGVFVFSDGMGYIIRQCEYVPHSNPPEIKLSARNEQYKPYTLALDKAAIIGRVIAKLEWL